MTLVLRAIRFRWIVRAMRIVQVQPEEKRAARILLQPGQCTADALAGGTLHQAQSSIGEGFGRERVIVEIKSAGQPPAAVENERADHRSRRIAVLLESLRYRTEARFERLPGEILDSVLEGVQTGQNGGMRRPGERNLRNGPLEDNAIPRQRIERGRLNF